MAFPDDPNDVEVGAAFGASLADDPTTLTYEALTPDYVRPGVRIVRGRVANQGTTAPTSITGQIRNPDGIFSPRNIAGPHYGELRRNTPLRVRVDPGSGMVDLATAYVPAWPPRWTGPDIDDRLSFGASGVLARLGIGQDSKSAIARTILATSPNAYWPLEDDSSATSGASAVGGPAMSADGVQFAQVTDLVGSVTAPAIGTAGLLRGVVTGVSASAWHCELMIIMAFDGTAVARVYTPSPTFSTFRVFMPSAAGQAVSVFVTDNTGGTVAVLTGTAVAASWENAWHHIAFTAAQSGGNVNLTLRQDGVQEATTSAAGTLAAPTEFLGNQNGIDVTSIAHVVLADGATVSDAAAAMDGYDGEEAAVRAARLCDEEGILVDVAAGDSEPMGPQLPGAILALLRECEASDEAVLVERKTGLLGFDPIVTRYNQAVALTLDYEQGHSTDLADPDDGAKDVVNYVTCTRIGGSSYTDEQVDGPLGTDPETGVGRYPETPSRSLAIDEQAANHASWIRNIGTIDEPRYVVLVNLTEHPELIDDWLACDIGSRFQITSPPHIHTGPAPIDLILEGYVEDPDPVAWMLTLFGEPSLAYEVLQIEDGDGNRSRIPAGASELAAGYDDNDTSLSVTSATVPWTDSATNPDDFPFTIEIAGEVMTCTAIAGTGLTQTFTVTRGLHGVSKDLPDGSAVQLWRPPRIAL